MPEIRDLAPYDDFPTDNEYRSIEFRTVSQTEVVGGWPEYTQMSLALLRQAETYHISINRRGQVVIKVANGWARYKLAETQDLYDALKLELVQSKS